MIYCDFNFRGFRLVSLVYLSGVLRLGFYCSGVGVRVLACSLMFYFFYCGKFLYSKKIRFIYVLLCGILYCCDISINIYIVGFVNVF